MFVTSEERLGVSPFSNPTPTVSAILDVMWVVS
jgi:hypothetical protein